MHFLDQQQQLHTVDPGSQSGLMVSDWKVVGSNPISSKILDENGFKAMPGLIF